MCRSASYCTLVVLTFTVVLIGCDREERRFREAPPSSKGAASNPMSPLEPGERLRRDTIENPYERNAQAVSEGKRLFSWFNCSGCHGNGGGGMGPALMDDKWIYGGDPASVYRTIVEGRPNGMPSFRGRL